MRSTAARLTLLSVLMFGFGFLLVPLYNTFCQVTGLNGKPLNRAVAPSQAIDLKRTIAVEFVTQSQPLAVLKAPMTQIRVHPGEMKRVVFLAKNTSDKPLRVQAIASISPGQLSQHFHKTECFCFQVQVLEPGKWVEFPLAFFIDLMLPPQIHRLTLSYTLFDVSGYE